MPGGVADDIRPDLNNSTADDPFGQLAHQCIAKEIAGESDRINWQLRACERRMATLYGGQASGHPLDPLSARRPWLERIAEILGLAGHLPVDELHDAQFDGRPS